MIDLGVHLQSGFANGIQIAHDQREMEGVNDVVIQNDACRGADGCGLEILGTAYAHLFYATGKAADRTAGVRIVHAKTVVVVIHQCDPTLGIYHKLGGPVSVTGILADDLGQRTTRAGVLTYVGDNAVKFTVGVHGRELLSAGAVLRLVGAVVVDACGDVDGLAVQRVPKLKVAFTGHVVECPLHGNALDVQRVALHSVLDQLGAVKEAISRLNGIPAGMRPVFAHFGALGMKRRGTGVKRQLNLSAPVGAVDQIGLAVLGKIGDRAAKGGVDAEFDVLVFDVEYVVV